ncbi:MAG: 50S ribosomal protein L29 [Bacteroidota bacterium]|jgi:ribosomal protein L29|nr:50S ribosomal protein L29 [Bacteroidota bacterium]
MKTSEIKELTTKEIQERLNAEKDSLVRLKLNHVVSPLDNPMKIRYARKNIARLMTEMCQRSKNDQK